MNSILSVQDLCLWYGSHQALKDINIEIPEKSITALIGPSRLRQVDVSQNA